MIAEIEFQEDFASKVALPIPLGRIHIGNYIGRLFFTVSGKTVLYVSKGAVADGSLVLLGEAEDAVLGLEKTYATEAALHLQIGAPRPMGKKRGN